MIGGVRDIGGLGTVLGVWAHPDDEAYLAGGVMAAAVDAGMRVVCVTATRGEASGREPGLTKEEVAAQRSSELEDALARLGVTDLRWLDFADGGCVEAEAGVAVARLRRIVEEVGPTTVLTFGPDGLTGHPDHVTVGAWAVAATVGTDAVVHAVTRTPQWMQRFRDAFIPTGIFRRGEPIATPRDDLSIHLELDGDLLETKYDAIRRHASQVDPVRAAIDDDVFRQALAEESFRVIVS